MKVVVKSGVEKDLIKFSKKIQTAVLERMQNLSKFPDVPQLKKLIGHAEIYRVRVGDYRILFSVDCKTSTIVVIAIAHRKEIYKYL